jgi:hypothetical protein
VVIIFLLSEWAASMVPEQPFKNNRRCDIYIYKLAFILRSRCRSIPEAQTAAVEILFFYATIVF